MSDQGAYQEPFKRIDVDEARRLLDSGQAVLVDVREQWEYARDRIPGATLVPLASVLARPQEAIKADNVIFHCEVGQRSAVAAEIAASLGFKNVYNLEGGIAAWKQKGYPIEK